MSRKETLEQFGSCWEGLEDPRCGNAALHDFHELLMIALCCVLCGGQWAVDMALFAEAKEPFLRSFLTLANGLPSHDTFSRLFRNLDPDQFRGSFQRFMAHFPEQLQGVVAIDGKVLRRSFDRAGGKSALHMVSAWGSEQRLVLAQIAGAAQPSGSTALGNRKQPALAAGRGDERGSGSNANGARTAQSRRAQAHGPQRHAKRGIKRLLARKIQTRRLGRWLPVPATGAILKCDCPVRNQCTQVDATNSPGSPATGLGRWGGSKRNSNIANNGM
jgi:hypothetical protein